MKPGDLVLTSEAAMDLNSEGLEIYVNDPWNWDSSTSEGEDDDMNVLGTWRHGSVGLVLQTYDEGLFDAHYRPVRVLVEGVLGWTYSDMLVTL